MTERQYKMLRKLLSLWIAVIARRRYSIFQNLLLASSVCLNVGLYLSVKDMKKPIINPVVVGINIEKALDLKEYRSIAYPSQTLLSRYNKVHSRYLGYKSKPDRIYFTKSGIVENNFAARCERELVRIMNIKNRLQVLQSLLLKTYPGEADKIYDLLNKYEDPLADMSNYYSKFLPTSKYDGIVKAYD